ncbi:MAG: Eco57I restriction-modification methylase domain-containing protein [Bacteroidales bacterium]|nr:Eco57I restriction-modification methylase domain-containing protein [Bacteroidales bacterium]
MQLTRLSPRKALNKAYLKVKPTRSEIEHFKRNLIGLLDGLNESESEEHNKNDVGDFLKNTFYHPRFYINTKDRTDLVIHIGTESKSLAGVLIEAKKPSNKSEMIRPDNINAKAFHELILYYLRESITNHNLEIKHLVATNIYEWYVFDASLFEKTFAQNKTLVKHFTDFEEGRLAGKTNDFFYKEIAEPFMAGLNSEFCFAMFDFRDYDKPLRNEDKRDDAKLIALYKLLSPEHLLKLPFINDSNSLDKAFYGELLHIIGLTETKDGGKKLIGRKKEGERNTGSLIENAIIQLDSLDKISRLDKPSQFGETTQERLFNVALELSITWINRILFLKLLEAQIIKYHKGDTSFAFLNAEKVRNFDDLNSLFFSVLARKPDERNEGVRKIFSNVPYLNISLFEPTDLEHSCLFISQLKDGKLPIITSTVLKDNGGNKYKGELDTLEYIFKFLDAYDFAGEGAEEIQEENKTLINASVLGLIFEKINGYKDGSFFTPGFITMYMCHETIRRAVVQKFNDAKGWDCKDIDQLYDKIEDRTEANRIINSLKICDPAVGSGHFLVSALNEIIAIKSDLNILQDRDGRRLKEYRVEVVNDELIATDEDGDLIDYNPYNKESQRIQQALFQEKQTIIENCLLGVDINPNSVKICRLRLWIELLKNAYYKEPDFAELETLPNIDINIKCGNSLISRHALDADISQALKKSKWSIDTYRDAIMLYRNAKGKEQKREMERLIGLIKSDFETEVSANDKRLIQLKKLNGDLFNLTNQTLLFEKSKKELADWNFKVKELTQKIQKIEAELEEVKTNKIYEDAFEWRFEFPEVLNDEGDFVGFDLVIGNPPYIRQEAFSNIKFYLESKFQTYNGTADLYVYFVERGLSILNNNGTFIYILPNKWMRAGYGDKLRAWIKQFEINFIIDFGDLPVFDEATTYPCLWSINKQTQETTNFISAKIETLDFVDGLEKYIDYKKFFVNQNLLEESGWSLSGSNVQELLKKIQSKGIQLGKLVQGKFFYGIKTGFNEAFVIDQGTRAKLIAEDPKNAEIIKPLLSGKDVKRYQTPHSNKYLLLMRRGIEINNYPSILAHLSRFESKLKAKAGSGIWYELQASPGDSSKFEENKIIYPDISKDSNFTLDEGKHYSLNTIYNIGSSSLGLLGYLNSKLFLFYFRSISNSIRGGYLRFFTDYMINCPIPKSFDVLENKTLQILTLKKSNPSADTSALENEIDQLVYELYGLTEEEIRIVEAISE